MFQYFQSLPAYQNILNKIKNNDPISGLGLSRSVRLPFLSSLYKDLQRSILFITDRTEHAYRLADETAFWLPDNHLFLFPEPNPLFYEQAAWGASTRRDRLQCLTNLASYHIPGATKSTGPFIMIAPIRAIMTRTLPRREFLKASKMIRRSDKISPETLQKTWLDIGYQFEDLVIEPGHFSRRGGILDIWPLAESKPVRMDFFGDEIDTLRFFDPTTQRTINNIDQILITPAREFLVGKAGSLQLEGHEINEFYLPLIHNSPASILDYLPAQTLVILDDLDSIQMTASEIEEQSVNFRKESIQEGIFNADFPVPYLSWSELEDSLQTHRWFELGRSTSEENTPLADHFSPGTRFGGRVKPFLDFLVEQSLLDYQSIVISRQIQRLKELWVEQESLVEEGVPPQFIEGSINEGWTLTLLTHQKVNILSDSEIFGWEKPKPVIRQKMISEAPEAFYSDLKPGDWVVHMDYGIGQYRGLVHKSLEGSEREFLLVEYDNGDQLFVPVHQADRLSRYIGPSGETPNPTRLGTQEWTQTKKRTREAVQEVARDLLELYASRQMSKGYAFKPDAAWQHELESSFPYVETTDQLKAIAEVKHDMESQRPMDRLLCGDVGYGKTEVALRAAFKAVLDNKQVAILVPTTVLAQQHYDTFRQRLAAYPVEVDMLSRFRTHKEQEQIIKRLQQGQVDIIIGTHRLIQQDVMFKDLGLVIIDEEQRFGVTHKEYFKKLRHEIDVLTLTATPIPRTLYMALAGVRDISSINTPPEERLPIITHIGPYSPRLVRQAVLRELERGGQIFFVHNRVQTINAMQRHLNHLVPEARVGIGHGQMAEHELSIVMDRFRQSEIDILLCTSIIESGLDIPNANTLIVDRGDTFGLAQLYQLRGRVGRSAQRAYAYFFRHRRKPPTPEGLERLETLAENTQLGAGYSIAMRDLEMRGAGELLGTHQHGHIAAVGFHLYTRLLAQAVRGLQQSTSRIPLLNQDSIKDISLPVTVDLPLSIGIPAEYIADQNLRLKLYRRLANVEKEDELQAISEEFLDRFGPLPEMVLNLFYQLMVRLRAESAGLAAVTLEGNQIVLKFPPLADENSIRDLPPIGYQIRSSKNAYRMLMDETWKEKLLEALSAIIELWNSIKV